MSIMDKLKAMFSGGSSAEKDHSHDGHDHSHAGHDHAMDDAPPTPAAPMDPLGTATPPASSEGDRNA